MQSFATLFPKLEINKDMKERFISVLHEYSPLKAEVVRTEQDTNKNKFIIIMLANEEFITLTYTTSSLVRFHYNFGIQTSLDIRGKFEFHVMMQFINSIVKLREVRAEWLE